MCSNTSDYLQSTEEYSDDASETPRDQASFEEEWNFYVRQLDNTADTPVEEGNIPW